MRRRRAKSSSAWEASTWWSWLRTGRGSDCSIRCATTCAAAARALSKAGTLGCLGRAGLARWVVRGVDTGMVRMEAATSCTISMCATASSGSGRWGPSRRSSLASYRRGRCGRGVARVGAREECHAAGARPSPQRRGRCGRGVARVGAREQCHAAEARFLTPWTVRGIHPRLPCALSSRN